MKISLISFLLSLNCYAGEMEKNIIIALMSYDKPRIYKDNIKKEIDKKLGRDFGIFLASTYQLIEKDKIQIPIRINETNYVMGIEKKSIHIFYKKEF
jgi:hypothetical protein